MPWSAWRLGLTLVTSMVAIDTGLLEDLQARGLVQDTTDRAELAERLSSQASIYVGFDPTAGSLHAGNLVGLLFLRRFQNAGHRVVSLAGGATGMIGDPSGKSDERNLLDDEGLAKNLAGIVPQLRQFLDFDSGHNPAKLLDNRAWTVGVPVIQFLRDVGKHITVNQMIAKESVKARMGRGEDLDQRTDQVQGISFTEFSYMLLQAHDFYWLYEHEGVELQGGGSDQWGNITLGIDLIRRKAQGSGFGITWPLLTKPDGTKYGKTAGGDTIWLSPEQMSPYRFYQAWLQVDDDELSKLLLQLTFLSLSEVNQAVVTHSEAPHQRSGQKLLAFELTSLVHGAAAAESAVAASDALFGGSVADLDLPTLSMLAAEVPTTVVSSDLLGQDGNLVDLLISTELASSKNDARKLLGQNGISINDTKADPETAVGPVHLMHKRFCLLRRGKKKVAMVIFEPK